MLLSHLFEMPYFVDKEMTPHPEQLTHFLSEDTLARDYKLIKQLPGNVAVYISNDHTMAVIGEMGQRPPNQKPGMLVFITAEFKNEQHLSNTMPSPQLKGALQIDVVEANRGSSKSRGFGTALYWALADAGITIISDNTQYRGGKALWVKLAQEQGSNYVINIIDNGKVRVDAQGQPVVYNGSNISDDELWSSDKKSEKYVTLFVLRKR